MCSAYSAGLKDCCDCGEESEYLNEDGLCPDCVESQFEAEEYKDD